MALLGNLFRRTAESVALIDVGSGSVGGAYVHYASNVQPLLVYAARAKVEPRAGESLTAAMLRALAEVNARLISEGSPALLRASGSGSVRRVLVSIASPWQETAIRVMRSEEKQPFTFTRALMNDLVAKSANMHEGRVASGESVIATLLNGYETSKPFGKKVTFADVVVLSSSIEKAAAESVERALAETYHTRRIEFAAFAPLAYAVFRDLYPHEKDFLVLDVCGEATDVAFVRQGLLVGVEESSVGIRQLEHPAVHIEDESDSKKGGVHVIKQLTDASVGPAKTAWLAGVVDALRKLSSEHALPRTIFLLSDDEPREYLKSALDDPTLRSLWLSDEPLRVVPVAPQHFSGYLSVGPVAEPDVFLMLLTLYHHAHGVDNR